MRERDNKIYAYITVIAIGIILIVNEVLKTNEDFLTKIKSFDLNNIVNEKVDNLSNTSSPKKEDSPKREDLPDEIEIKLRPMREFSGMSRDEVLALRKQAVMKSPILSNPDYEPNNDVYMIEDGLQWISAYESVCYGSESTQIGRGDSIDSIGILNPELMFYQLVPNYAMSSNNLPCSKSDYLVPYKVIYSKETNTITAYVHYKGIVDKTGAYHNVILDNANARDAGYNYAFVSDFSNIKFRYDNNFSEEIMQTMGFYHRGYSCGLSEGCNNYSPYQQEEDFFIQGLPAIITIKLWKEYPLTKYQNADLTYRVIYE